MEQYRWQMSVISPSAASAALIGLLLFERPAAIANWNHAAVRISFIWTVSPPSCDIAPSHMSSTNLWSHHGTPGGEKLLREAN